MPNYSSYMQVHKAPQQRCQRKVNHQEGRKCGNRFLELKCHWMSSNWKKTQLSTTKAITNVRPRLRRLAAISAAGQGLFLTECEVLGFLTQKLYFPPSSSLPPHRTDPRYTF